MKVGIKKMSLRKNDQVIIITGAEKGKIGKIIALEPKSGRVKVEGLNLVTRATKKSDDNPAGGFVSKERSIDFSNVQLHCKKCDRGVRHTSKMLEGQNKKVRICKRCNEQLDVA